jgi:aminoglycoside phosphotransferase (APT) family kinase protein
MTPPPALAGAGVGLSPLLRSVLPEPRRVRQIATKAKSVVLVIESRREVLIAKKGTAAGLRCERDVYQTTLPTLGIPAPTVRGWIDSPEETWLVIDHLEGRPPVLRDPADLYQVSTWVAQLHHASRTIAYPDPAPALGRPTPEERLGALRTSITSRDGADSDSGWALNACAEVERALPLVREAATLLPTCLVHGDLSDLNIVITQDAAVVIDWDQAARRSPAIDLALVDVGSYCAELGRLGDHGQGRHVSRAQPAGTVLANLSHDLARKPFKTQLKYLYRMVRAVRALRRRDPLSEHGWRPRAFVQPHGRTATHGS